MAFSHHMRHIADFSWILHLLLEGHMIYFCEVHECWRTCALANRQYNIIFYQSHLHPFVRDFLQMYKDMPENNNYLVFHGCPMCDSEE